ncbi:MAG: sulfite exporter TauE/SafE family protein [Clostridia bacterium]|nr:sulfite exporter TauE/SafE family protein [Clostridia bacterium]
MQYLIAFLEGVVTFISPCLLPMLPIYVSYFAGGNGAQNSRKTFINALGFVLGFTLVFVAMGAMAGTLGSLLKRYQLAVNIVTGLIVIFFGLHFLGVFNLGFLKGISKKSEGELGFFSSILFGIVFSVGWTPCVGAFLGSALLLASQQGHALRGIIMLLLYSIGLGIPFVASALLINKLKSAFDWIKRNYTWINRICGILLIIVGVLMMTGLLGNVMTLFD